MSDVNRIGCWILNFGPWTLLFSPVHYRFYFIGFPKLNVYLSF